MATIRPTNGWGNHGGYRRQAREFICERCGEPFVSKGSIALNCPPCREIANREYAEEELAKRRAKSKASESLRNWSSYRYEVLADPDPCCGLSRGARFTDRDVQLGLEAGYWTPGTRLLDRKEGGELVVIGRAFTVQALSRSDVGA